MKIFLVIQLSNVDGEHLVDVTPCNTIDVAKRVMNAAICDLAECTQYKDADFDDLERKIENDEDTDFILERSEKHFYIETVNDSYFEDITIVEKEIVGK